jgi:beta-galactosidase
MQTKTFEEQLDFYPYGVQYHRAPTPLPEEWEGDLKEIKRVGFTHIQLRPQWRWHERNQGSAVWDDLDRLFDLAHKNQLRVVLKPMLETAPDWVFEKGVSGSRIGIHGVPISPIAHGAYYVGGWWPCFDNPHVVRAASDFVARMVRRFKDHPALWFYDAWNEPVSRPVGQCQCEHSIASYRNWLREKYGTIENLNNFFGKAWTSFETLRPPVVHEDYTELFIWRQWAAWSIAEQVKFVADTIKKNDPKSFVIVHIGQSSVTQDPVWATSDDLLNAKMTDRYGTSFWVPLHPATPTDHAHPDYQSDWLRRVDPSYWCHEFYTNHANWCRPPEPKNLNRLIWMAIAGGAAGFTFWQYRSERVGNETNGYGCRNIDGSPSPRSEVTDGIAKTLTKFGSKLVGTKRDPSPVGLVYHRQSDLILRIQESNSDWGSGGLAVEKGCGDYSYKKAIKAAHALYLANGQTVDWVVPGDNLSAIKLLHLTCMEMIDDVTAKWLTEYVRNGGRLIIEFPFACRDERTWVTHSIPSSGLQTLLGCYELNRIVTLPELTDIAAFSAGQKITAKKWRIDLKPTTAAPIAHWQDGAAAAVKNTFGKGTVYALGINLSLAYSDTWTDPAVNILAGFLQEAGLPTGFDPQLWVRKRKAPGREIWFVFNIANTDKKLALPAKPREIWQESGCTLKGQDLTLTPGSAWIAEMPL